jgi:crotonobetainyl-CoA:carnitine CoA-transferase CaiB-like acyl-CoA transferase
MHADPQALARDMIVSTQHPVAGQVMTIGLPVKFSKSPGRVSRPSPLKGEHTVEVLREAGFDESAIRSLLDAGAAVAHDVNSIDTHVNHHAAGRYSRPD